MKKKISKKKQVERNELLKKSKIRRLILALSVVPPFSMTVLSTVFYALKDIKIWLLSTTAALWFLLGALFIYALIKKWGNVSSVGARVKKSYSIVTVYNIVLIFLLGILFTVLSLINAL